jgi:hypothetical protein
MMRPYTAVRAVVQHLQEQGPLRLLAVGEPGQEKPWSSAASRATAEQTDLV